MSEVVLADEKLVSTSRAAELVGYSRDYIGQLCRSGGLKCKMISDQWYIDPESLRKYVPDPVRSRVPQDGTASNGAEKKAYSVKIGDVRSGAFKYDGAEYVPTQKAAELSGYTQDYIGQLARGGEIPARKVGRRWYIAREALLEHKEGKDSMLRAVQSDASGIAKEEDVGSRVPIRVNFDVKYFSDTGVPLIPRGVATTESDKPAEDESPAAQESTTKGRFGTITNIAKQKPLINTHLGYTRNTATEVQPTQSISKTQIKSVPKPSHTTTAGAKIVIVLFTTAFLVSSIIFGLIYLGMADEGLLEPLSPVCDAFKSLEEKYGEYIPGRTIEYSN